MAIGFLSSKWKITRRGPDILKRANVEEISDDLTVDAADSGKILLVTVTGKTITLPAISGFIGMSFTVMSAAKGITLAISPNSGDKIIGLDFTAADDKDALCTSEKGDYIKLIGEGTHGWYIAEAVGTWTRE